MNNIVISNGVLRAEISPCGGELRSLGRLDGDRFIEYLWQGDAKYWSGRAPLLFPIVGRFRGGAYLHGGHRYEMGCHGFAARLTHKVKKLSDTEVETSFCDTPETRAQYPFGFFFTQRLMLDADTLHITLEVEAHDELWCAMGGHPGFVLPSSEGDTAEFDSLYVRVHGISEPLRMLFSNAGLVLPERVPFALDENGCFAILHRLFDNEAVVLCDVKSATLASHTSPHSVTVSGDDITRFGFWQPAGSDAPFVCLEPWQGEPARDGDPEVLDELSHRTEMRRLAPGQKATHSFDITLK